MLQYAVILISNGQGHSEDRKYAMDSRIIKETEKEKGIDTLRKTAYVETHENVTLSFETANVPSRLAAYIVDGIILALIYVALFFAVLGIFRLASGPASSGSFIEYLDRVFDSADRIYLFIAIVFLAIFLVKYLYHLLWEYFTCGLTPGKKACGLRVVSVTGEPPSFGMIAVRNVFRLIHMIPGLKFADAVIMALSPKSMRTGDYVAKTMVVKFRTSSKSFASRMDAILQGSDEKTDEAEDEEPAPDENAETEPEILPEQNADTEAFFTREEYLVLKDYYSRRSELANPDIYDRAWVRLISEKSGAKLPEGVKGKYYYYDFIKKATDYLGGIYENSAGNS